VLPCPHKVRRASEVVDGRDPVAVRANGGRLYAGCLLRRLRYPSSHSAMKHRRSGMVGTIAVVWLDFARGSISERTRAGSARRTGSFVCRGEPAAAVYRRYFRENPVRQQQQSDIGVHRASYSMAVRDCR